MAWEDYIAVVDSNLYEQAGLAKPILSRIAYLIVGPREEGQEADPNEGWCFATQDYLAANTGCSESEVQHVCLMFVEDGWLSTRVVRNRYGHPHKHYRWADGAMSRIKEHKMKKDEQGRFIRAKNTNKANKKSFTASSGEDQGERQPSRETAQSSRQGALEPHGSEPSSFTARKRKPHGKLPEKEVVSECSEQVFPASKHAHRTDASLDHFVETRENPGPRERVSLAGQIEEDELSNPVHTAPPAPARETVRPAPAQIVKKTNGHRFAQTYNGLKCLACKTGWSQYEDKGRKPCPNEEMELEAVDAPKEPKAKP